MNALDVALTVLNFTAAEFAAAPALDIAERRDTLLMSEFEGIAISAPAAVRAGDVLPIAIAVRFDHARAWDVPLGWNLTLVATNLETGQVILSEPFEADVGHKRHSENAPLERGPRPPDAELEGVAADISWTDSERAQVPLDAGTWRIVVIYFDWVSNVAEVAVAGEPRVPEPLAPWPLPTEGKALPSYLPPDRGPAAPSEAGFDVGVRDEGGVQSLLVSGQASVVPRPWMTASGTLFDGAARDVVAAVPVTTVWAQRDAGRGHDLRFVMPVYSPQPAPDMPLQGTFALDLLAGADGYRLPVGHYAVWLLAGGDLHGPVAAEIAESN